MKHSIVLAVTLASGIAVSAAAQTPAAPASVAPSAPAGPAKIAVIQFQLAVAQTNEGQRYFADLQKKYEPREKELRAANDEIETLKKQLQDQGATLTDADRAAKAKTIDEKGKKLQRNAEDLREEGNKEIQEMLNALGAKVYDVLASYSQQQGYTLVLDVSEQQNPVLYASESTNITKPVIDAYNVKSGVPAQPAPAAARRSRRPRPRGQAARDALMRTFDGEEDG
jgi:outer membrane protein